MPQVPLENPGSPFPPSFPLLNPNSLDNKGSWRILKDCYCSVTMFRELGLIKPIRGLAPHILFFYVLSFYPLK